MEGVTLAKAKRGFVLLPRRWVVERSFRLAGSFPAAPPRLRTPVNHSRWTALAGFFVLATQQLVQNASFKFMTGSSSGILDGLDVQGHPSSYHLWLTPGNDLIADEVCASLQHDRIETTPARLFVAAKTPVPNAFRMALGQERNEEKLVGAIREIARRCKHVAG